MTITLMLREVKPQGTVDNREFHHIQLFINVLKVPFRTLGDYALDTCI